MVKVPLVSTPWALSAATPLAVPRLADWVTAIWPSSSCRPLKSVSSAMRSISRHQGLELDVEELALGGAEVARRGLDRQDLHPGQDVRHGAHRAVGDLQHRVRLAGVDHGLLEALDLGVHARADRHRGGVVAGRDHALADRQAGERGRGVGVAHRAGCGGRRWRHSWKRRSKASRRPSYMDGSGLCGYLPHARRRAASSDRKRRASVATS